MKKLAIIATLIAFAAPSLAAEPADSKASDPMQGWSPPKVKNEKADRAEITALMKKMDAAGKKGDLEAAMALVDFPVFMTTDNSKGEGMAAAWNADQYRKQMEPAFKPMPDMKVTNKPTIFLMSDSLATVTNVATITMGKKTMVARNSLQLIRTGGEWKIKAMTEGGWGDMMGDHGGTSGAKSSAAEPATGPTGGTAPSGTESPGTGPSGTSTATEPSPTTPPASK